MKLESPDRPASRILAATAYIGLALIFVAVPATYYIAHLDENEAPAMAGTLASQTLWVAAATALACLTALLLFRVLALKRVRQIEDELRFRAEHDLLTGLLNRGSLRMRVAEACSRADRSGNSVAVMFVDLDDFKMVNDTMGHAAGDALLRDVATRLRDTVRAGDIVARLGGDEFALLFENIRNDSAATIAASLLQRVRDPYSIAGRRHDLSCCIGIALHPADSGDPDQLLAYGNIAMQECKRRGKSDYAFYSRRMQSALEERLREQRLVRQAWEAREFSLAYQPICDMERGRLTGAEALIRWHSDEEMTTNNLVKTLEDIGLIDDVGAWVVREACKQGRAWDDAGLPHFVMSVNVSPRQFRDGEKLVNSVRDALADSGLSPGRLQIEITEGAMMENQGESLLTLNQLKGLGIMIAVDDFGTGYSSLSYLKHFPVDALKIDRVFVSELTEQAAESNIVIAIVQLARGLNLSVIAEGVENEQQLALLQRYGCDTMQGYALATPLAPWQFEQDVLRSPRWLFDRTRTLPAGLVGRPRDGEDREDRTVPARSVTPIGS